MSEHTAKKQKTSSNSTPLAASTPLEAGGGMSLSTPTSNPDTGNDMEEDNLFPGAEEPTTVDDRPPTPEADHDAATTDELSPPRSQAKNSRSAANGFHAADDMEVGPMETAEQKQDDVPGAGWKNKKAQEEMQRAWDHVVDRDLSLKEFGDVILLGKQQRGEN